MALNLEEYGYDALGQTYKKKADVQPSDVDSNEWAEVIRRMDRLEAEMVESRKVMIELLARLRASSLPAGATSNV